jgi:hypothetical protein
MKMKAGSNEISMIMSISANQCESSINNGENNVAKTGNRK